MPPEPNNIVKSDITGDGRDETIEVYYKKYTFRAPDGEELDFKYPYIRTVVNGMKYEHYFGNIFSYGAKIHAFNPGIENKQAMAVVFDVGGTGKGTELLYVIMFDDGFKFMPLPKCYNDWKVENASYGFKADVRYIDDYKARVTCEETKFTEDIPLDKELYKSYSKDEFTRAYDENGKAIGSPSMVDGICEVRIVSENGMQYKVVRQKCVANIDW